MRRFLAVLVAFAMLPLDAAAATAASEVGHPRIRVTAPSFHGKRLVGVLISLDETTLRIEREEGQPWIAVPRASITRLETSRHRSRKAQGAGIGFLFGVAAAFVIGQTAGTDCSDRARDDTPTYLSFESFCLTRGELTAASAFLMVPAGALLGLLVSPGEKWDVVNADRLRLTVTPGRGGVRAALAIRF